MFKIHKKIKYALTALKYMNEKPREELTTAKEICERFDLPFDPTSRVLQIMTQHRILRAEQGAYGGYRLSTDLSKVTIFDLSRMIVGPLAISDCVDGKSRSCDRSKKCIIREPIARLNSRLLQVFKEVQVSEMI